MASVKILFAVLLLCFYGMPELSAQEQEIVTVYNGSTAYVGQGVLINGRRHGEWKIFSRKPQKPSAVPYVSQSSNQRVSDKQLKKHFNMNQPHQVIHYRHGILNGEFEEFYPSGAIKFRVNLVSGKLDGDYEAFYEDGSQQVKGFFRQDKPHQEWHRFFANGVQESLEFYYNGLRVGDWKWFHENGELRETIAFIQDAKQGAYQSFFRNGQLQEQGTFDKNEKVGVWQTYFDNGQLASQESFSFGMPDGKWEYYTIDGKLLAGGTYSLGKKLGTWTEETGLDDELLRTGFYLEDVKSGTWKVVNRQGHVFQEEVYDEGKLLSVSNFKDTSSQVKDAGTLANGDGERIFYDAEGRVIQKGGFVKGIPHGVWLYFEGESSNLKKLGGYLEGNAHGEWLTYNAEGKVVDREYFEYGEQLKEDVLRDDGNVSSVPLLRQSPTLDSNTAMHHQGTSNHFRNMFYSSRYAGH
ncbi:toxin-antitoxin system YwqK family antitoxin [Mongoliitalea lutea]|nr:toxin-antitoxin system YwqK family antitoxin [Mongoliitalea lutea]